MHPAWPPAPAAMHPVPLFQRGRPAACAQSPPPSPPQALCFRRPPLQYELLRHYRPLLVCQRHRRQLSVLDLQTLPCTFGDSLSILDCSSSFGASQEWLCWEESVCLQQGPHWGHSGPVMETPGQQGAHSVLAHQTVSSCPAEGQDCRGAVAVGKDAATPPWADETTYSERGEDHGVHTIMVDDTGIVACVVGDALNPDQANPADGSASTRDGQPPPHASTSTSTQTEGPETAHQQINTEVHVADLDYLAQEFIKLKEQHRKMKSCMKLCTQRAEWAELRLLALHYTMCAQHCYRLYYTSAEGNLLKPTLKDADVLQPVLQELQSDYEELRRTVRAGVPLQQLQPLSVRSESLAAGARYTPAQMVDDALGTSWSGKSVEPQKLKASWEDSGHDGQAAPSGDRQEEVDSRTGGAAKDVWTLAACEDGCSGEAWYDAQEDLQTRRAEDAVDRGRAEGPGGDTACRPERDGDGV